MKARKCDRCKNYFDEDSKRSEMKVVVWLEEPVVVDLCPDCTAQLLCWIKNEADVVDAKHGKWIGDDYTCSECGESLSDMMDAHSYFKIGFSGSNFCPNCGADMRGRIE